MPQYNEKEITEQVLLCKKNGSFNRDSTGWSRKPLHIANMKGHWPRKKKWNHWVVTNDEFSFCTSFSNVDYVGLAHAYLLDFGTGELIEETSVLPFGIGCNLPEAVEENVRYRNRKISLSFEYNTSGMSIRTEVGDFGGKRLRAELDVHIPPDHESVNVVIPFDNGKYRYTSKQTAMPVSGTIKHGSKEYRCDPENTFACLDYNRSVIDYKTTWNWATGAGRQDGDVIGFNFGAKWCYGRGITQNGICVNGKIHKIAEDIICTYNDKNFMEPWELKTEISDRVDLRVVPFHEKVVDEDFVILKTNVHQVYGHFSGTVGLDDGTKLEIKKLLGWAEEQKALW